MEDALNNLNPTGKMLGLTRIEITQVGELLSGDTVIIRPPLPPVPDEVGEDDIIYRWELPEAAHGSCSAGNCAKTPPNERIDIKDEGDHSQFQVFASMTRDDLLHYLQYVISGHTITVERKAA